MADRDPRVDPKAGDRIAKGKLTRRVTEVQRSEIWYLNRNDGLNKCWISTWREWARKAEVLHAA